MITDEENMEYKLKQAREIMDNAEVIKPCHLHTEYGTFTLYEYTDIETLRKWLESKITR